MGVFWASFSLRMGQFSDPVATHPRTNEADVPPRDSMSVLVNVRFIACLLKRGFISIFF